MKKFLLLILFACLLMPTFAEAATVYAKKISTTVYYDNTATSCDAVTDGDSSGDLEDALNAAAASGTLYICAGTYSNTDLDADSRLDTKAASQTIQGVGTAILSSTGTNTLYNFAKDGVTYDNLTVQGASSYLIEIRRSSNITVQNCTFSSSTGGGIRFYQNQATDDSGLVVQDNSFTNTGAGIQFSFAGRYESGDSSKMYDIDVLRNTMDGVSNGIVFFYPSWGATVLAFTSGSEEPEVGEVIEDADEGRAVYGTIEYVDLDSGTWAGGDAAGYFYMYNQVGTFDAGEIDISDGDVVLHEDAATIAGDSSVSQNVTRLPYDVNIQYNTISNTTGYAFNLHCSDTSANLISNNVVSNIGDGSSATNAFQLGYCKNLIVENNTIDTVTADGTNDGNGIIIDNKATYCSPGCNHVYQSDGVTVRYNTISGCDSSTVEDNPSAGIEIWSGDNTVVHHNLIYDCDAGIKQRTAASDDNEIYNNTIYNSDFAGGIMSNGAEAGDGVWRNNIFYGDGTSYGIFIDDDGSEVPTTHTNNIYYNNNASCAGAADPIDCCTGAGEGNCDRWNKNTPAVFTAGTGESTADPEMLDPAGGDFSLAAGSPCVNTGASVYSALTTDLEGKPCTDASGNPLRGSGVDIGALEFQYNPRGLYGTGMRMR